MAEEKLNIIDIIIDCNEELARAMLGKEIYGETFSDMHKYSCGGDELWNEASPYSMVKGTNYYIRDISQYISHLEKVLEKQEKDVLCDGINYIIKDLISNSININCIYLTNEVLSINEKDLIVSKDNEKTLDYYNGHKSINDKVIHRFEGKIEKLHDFDIPEGILGYFINVHRFLKRIIGCNFNVLNKTIMQNILVGCCKLQVILLRTKISLFL